MEETARAYAAGIVDGEGCIEILKWKTFRTRKVYGPRYVLAVEIQMADNEVLDWLQERLGGAIITKFPKNSRHRTCYRWMLYSKRAFDFLQEIKDFIVLKKEQIKIAEEFTNKPKEEREKLYTNAHSKSTLNC